MYFGDLSALTPGFPMIFTCLPAALFALIHDTFIQLPHVHESVPMSHDQSSPRKFAPGGKIQIIITTLMLKLFPRKSNPIK